MHFHTYQSEVGWHWQVRTDSSEVIAECGESYPSQAEALFASQRLRLAVEVWSPRQASVDAVDHAIKQAA